MAGGENGPKKRVGPAPLGLKGAIFRRQGFFTAGLMAIQREKRLVAV